MFPGNVLMTLFFNKIIPCLLKETLPGSSIKKGMLSQTELLGFFAISFCFQYSALINILKGFSCNLRRVKGFLHDFYVR